MTALAVRLEVLLALNADPYWRRRLVAAQSHEEVKQVIVAFGKAKGYTIVELPAQKAEVAA